MAHSREALDRRIRRLQWILPPAVFLASLVFQLVIAGSAYTRLEPPEHSLLEVGFYGLAGGLLLHLGLRRLGKELEAERSMKDEKIEIASHLAAVAGAAADAILTLDSQGRLSGWNRGAEELFGYEGGDVLGKPFYLLLGEGKAQQVESGWLADTVLQTGFVRGYQTVCRIAGGRQCVVELTATRLADGEGMSIVLRDVTSSKRRMDELNRRYEQLSRQISERTRELADKVDELREANRELQKLDQTRAEFVSVVAHQLRAPLTNIRGAMERISSRRDLDDPAGRRMLDIIDQQITRLDRLVDGVLSTLRIESGQLVVQPEPLSLAPLIGQVIDQIRARAIRRPIQLRDKPGLPMAYADRHSTSEVLTNLLDNADKFSPPGGKVFIDVRASQEEVTVTVRDRGHGFHADALTHVFEKFYRVDSSDSQTGYGYGLGLFICRRLVEAQSGRIWVENHPDGGAMVSFTLPVVPERL